MTQKRTFQFNKLVRDKVPEIMASEGIDLNMRIMDKDEYIASLKAKIMEEAKEVAEAPKNELLEELADVIEVLYSIAKAHDFTPEEIELARAKKTITRGGFEKRIYVKNATTSSNSRLSNYLASKPTEYPEMEVC